MLPYLFNSHLLNPKESLMTSITQRQELHKGIWKIANDLRGSVDGWDFKNYVLGFLFYRFICENLIHYIHKIDVGGGTRF